MRSERMTRAGMNDVPTTQ